MMLATGAEWGMGCASWGYLRGRAVGRGGKYAEFQHVPSAPLPFPPDSVRAGLRAGQRTGQGLGLRLDGRYSL